MNELRALFLDEDHEVVDVLLGPELLHDVEDGMQVGADQGYALVCDCSEGLAVGPSQECRKLREEEI